MYSKNYLKKIGTLALAGVMALSLSIPAFASGATTEGSTTEGSTTEGSTTEGSTTEGSTTEGSTTEGSTTQGSTTQGSTNTAANSTEVTAKYQEATISVTVPAKNETFINPYGLPTEFTYSAAQSDGATSAKISGQIVSTPMAICNDGDYALSVGAKVTTKAAGNAKIVARLTSKGTDNEIAAQLQLVQAGKDIVGEKTKDATTIADAVIKASANSTTWDEATSVTLDTTNPVTKDGLVTLAASKVAADKTVTYNEGSIALVRLTGSCIESPTKEWAETDGFTATIAYTFKPAAEE
jgi:hypothetical protein